MININRRRLLRGLFAAPAIVAVGSLMPISVMALDLIPPRLWGDGIHDDTAALQWRMDQLCRKEGGVMYLERGVYMTRSSLVFEGFNNIKFNGNDSMIIAAHDYPYLDFKDGDTALISNVQFKRKYRPVETTSPKMIQYDVDISGVRMREEAAT